MKFTPTNRTIRDGMRRWEEIVDNHKNAAITLAILCGI